MRGVENELSRWGSLWGRGRVNPKANPTRESRFGFEGEKEMNDNDKQIETADLRGLVS